MGPGKANSSPDHSNRESVDIPSNSEIIETKRLSRQFCEEIYNHGVEAQGGDWCDDKGVVHSPTAELPALWKDKVLLQVFFDEMVEFIEEKVDPNKRDNFFWLITDIFMDETGWVNSLTVPQLLFWAAKLGNNSAYEEWRKSILHCVMLKFEDLRMFDSNHHHDMIFPAEKVQDAAQGKTVADVLNLINLVEEMASLGWGLEYKMATHLFKELKILFPIPFVEYAIAAAQKKVIARKQEARSPKYAQILAQVVTWPISNKDSSEAEYLQDIITPKKALERGEKFQKISTDYVGVMDGMNQLVQLGHFEAPNSVHRSSSLIKALLEKVHRVEGKDYYQYLMEVHQTVFLPQYGDDAFSKWVEIMPQYDVQKWRDFFSLCSKLSNQERKDEEYLGPIHEIRKKVRINLRDRIQRNNEQESLYTQLSDFRFYEFVRDFLESGNSMLHEQLRSLVPTMSERKEVDFYDLADIGKNQRLRPFLQNPKQEALLLSNIMRPELRTQIETDLHCSIREIPLRSQIQFLKYLSSRDRTQFNKLRKVLQKNPDHTSDILGAFLVCGNDSGLGDEILALASRPEAQEVFALVSSVLRIIDEKQALFNEINSESETGKSKAEQKIALAVLRRTIELIQEVNKLPPGQDLVAYLHSAKAYQKETVAWGALFSAYVEAQKGRETNSQEFAEVFKDISVDILPCGNLVKSKERAEMIKFENYNNPKSFNEKDYGMLVTNLRKAYTDIDPEWLEYLVDNIPHDLNNSHVQFVLVRDARDNRVVGMCKIKPDSEDGTYYFGTHYVNEEFQKGFGIGNYLQQIAQSQIPEGSKIVATVAVANPAMERHIEAHNGVGNKIVYESDAEHKSKELIKFTWNHQLKLASKDNHKYSQAMLKAVIEKGQGSGRPDVVHGPGANMISMKCDTSPTNNQDFLEKSRQYFSKGYVLSRIFYNQKRGKPDLSQTYAVFEKPQTEIKQADLDQAAE